MRCFKTGGKLFLLIALIGVGLMLHGCPTGEGTPIPFGTTNNMLAFPGPGGGGMFSGGLIGVNYDWGTVSRCKNLRDNNQSGCNPNAIYLTPGAGPLGACKWDPPNGFTCPAGQTCIMNYNGSGVNSCFTAPPPACNGSPNPFCSVDQCKACYAVDMSKMMSAGVGVIRTYIPNYATTQAAKENGIKVIVGTDLDTVAKLANNAGYAATFLNGSYAPYITPIAQHIGDGTIVGILLGNEMNGLKCGGLACDANLVGRAATNLRAALGAVTNGGSVIISTSLTGIPTGPVGSSATDYCNQVNIQAVGIDLYCSCRGQSPPIGCSGGRDKPPACVTSDITNQFQNNLPVACQGKAFIGETGYTTGLTNAVPGTNDTNLYPTMTSMLNCYVNWACQNNVQSMLFEWFDEYEVPFGAGYANKFFGLYEWTTTAAGQPYPTQKYQGSLNNLFSCPATRSCR